MVNDYDEKRMTCICCGKEKAVLINVECTGDSFLATKRGVCQACIKSDKNIEEVTKQYEIDKAKEGIREAENHAKILKEELEKLKK